jgi:lipopolysaccharide/colanic/teichoic acid biosynthesis glycosyltransferase
MAKHLFDITISIAGLIVVTPLLAILGLIIKLDSPGPVFYKSKRVGRDGVIFEMVKLRTMVVNADRMGSCLTQGGDPRITRVGSVLRRYKLDELPQLFNVLRGEMSIVGPRPESPCYVQTYTADQRRVLQVRPGITGQTQILFRHEESLLQGYTDLEKAYVNRILPVKLALDLDYVEHQSLSLDLRLVLQTVLSLFKREPGSSSSPLISV